VTTDSVLRQGVDVTDLDVIEIPDEIFEAHPELSVIFHFQIKIFGIRLRDLSIRPSSVPFGRITVRIPDTN
jgi:hypothetical protein